MYMLRCSEAEVSRGHMYPRKWTLLGFLLLDARDTQSKEGPQYTMAGQWNQPGSGVQGGRFTTDPELVPCSFSTNFV